MRKFQQSSLAGMAISCGDTLPQNLFSITLPEILQQAANQTKGIVYHLQNDTAVQQSYAELLEAAAKILTGLRQQKLEPQERVVLQLQNQQNFLACLWACWLGGFIPVPLGTASVYTQNSSDSKLLQVCKLCQPRLIVTELDLENAIGKYELTTPVITIESFANSSPDDNYHYSRQDDLTLLLFTSGSTGMPKGVMLSTRNLLASVYGMAKVNGLSHNDVTLNWMPLEHVASLVMFHLTEVYLGCQQIQVASQLILQHPLKWLDLISQYRVTATWSPNFGYGLVNEQLEKKVKQRVEFNWDLSAMRWMGNGAEAVVGQTTKRFLELLAPYGLSADAVSPGYGMSETCSGIAHSHCFGKDDNDDFVEVGAPIPGVKLRIVDEMNQVISEGETGLLQVQGATLFKGYYGKPELNQEIFTDDGWFNTGDLGFLKDGRLTITGRQKDIIIINGVNYYNHEIEAVVATIPGVTVSYTAACSVKDSRNQEQIAVFFHTVEADSVKLLQLISKIRKTVFTQLGVNPRYILPVSQAAIPKTAIGKIQRQQLSQRFQTGEFDIICDRISQLFKNRKLDHQELPRDEIEQKLVQIWQQKLNIEIVSIKDNFFELGGNSLLLMQILNEIATKLATQVSVTDLFQYPTIKALATYLNSNQQSLAVQQGRERGELRRKQIGDRAVAIVGMSCRFPGAENLDQFWSNLSNGVESISFFNKQELATEGVEPDLIDNPNYVNASPILDRIEDFDAEFWGYSPKEARILDPQQRLFLECAWESLEDAGYNPFNYDGDISIYGGAANNTYLLNHVYPSRHLLDEQDSLQVVNLSSMGGFQTTVANDKDYLTTRVSYKLNLTGSSVNVQTACSTSLVAVHLACQSILNGECDLALAGGVSVHTPQKMGYLYQEGMILAQDGHCRAFDAEATGTIFGSGAGVVVLKDLERAINDGDRIYAVIKGSAVNNDGGSKVGYLAPNVDGQARVIAEALAIANVNPETVSYVEAHGTGTKLGDPIEIAALTQAFNLSDKQSNCAIGSVKTNVGHLQIASGIVGLIKTALSVYHQKIPASLHYQQANPQINFQQTPFYVNTKLQPWQTEQLPLRAGVNSLGIGGTNAHVILEGRRQQAEDRKQELQSSFSAQLLTLSAKTEAALKVLITRYQEYLTKHPEIQLNDICFTANTGRAHFEHRLAIVCRDQQHLLQQLNSQISDHDFRKIIYTENKIAWLFTGQGSQYQGMGRQLYQTQSVFKQAIDRCAEILEQYLEQPPLEILDQESSSFLNQTIYAQPALFSIEYALAQLWLSWGIKPDIVMGHSIGEYVAACLAGVFSLEDGLNLVAARGRLIQSLPENGAMLAAFADKNQLESVINLNTLNNNQIALAADNGTHLVVSGLKVEIDKIAAQLKTADIQTKYLEVSHAFHSPLMQPMIEEFRQVAESIDYSLPQLPLVSNVTGEIASKNIACANYWVEHILQPVQFAQSIENLAAQQVNIWLEIGTKPTLTAITKSLIVDERSLFISTLNPKQEEQHQILTCLAELYLRGVDINWQGVNAENCRRVSLPTYPFQRKRYWFDLPKPNSIRPQIKSTHPLLGQKISSPLKQTLFQAQISLNNPDFLQDHCLNNNSVFPGAAYLEMALAAGVTKFTTPLTLTDITIQKPLWLSDTPVTVQLILTPEADSATWQIYSQDRDEWSLHSEGQILSCEKSLENIDLRQLQQQFANNPINVSNHYQQCQQRGINYGANFQVIKQLWGIPGEALGKVEITSNLDHQYKFSPALLDGCCQVLFAALPPELQTNTYLPVGLDQFNLYSPPESKLWSHVQLKNTDHPQIITADLRLYGDRGNLICHIAGLKSQQSSTQPTWHSWLYKTEWQICRGKQRLAHEQQFADQKFNNQGHWLILGDDNDLSRNIVNLLQSQQQQCSLITSPSLIKETISKIDRQLTGIIYLWSSDQQEIKNLSNLDTATETCRYSLNLIQTLIKHNQNPQFWFVTRNAQPVVENYPPTASELAQSCLWGMVKAIALEHPEFSPVLVDLDSQPTKNESELIFKELYSADKEDQIAFRNNQRYVPRLKRFSLNNQSTSQQLQITNPGNLDSLKWQTIPRLQPTDNQIAIEVEASGLNFRDVMVALNLYPGDDQFLGLECAGKVVAVGQNVSDFQIGDHVMAIAPHSFSNYLTVNSLFAIHQPDNLTSEAAATIPVIFLTAYYTLVHLAKLQPEEKVLIHSAAGGVGLAAIAIAHQLGAEVYATASPPKWDLLKFLGVKHIMNSRTLDFATQVGNKKIDIVLNSLSGEFIPQSLGLLKDNGRFIEIGKQGIWQDTQVKEFNPTISYFVVDLWQVTQTQPALIRQMLIKLSSQFQSGTLQPLPYKTFNSEQVVDAFRYMQQAKHQGKIVITQDRQDKFSSVYRDTYLITGGMGALGLQVAHWLVTKGIKHLVLMGRSDVKPHLRSLLEQLQKICKVIIFHGDVADEQQLNQALTRIESTLPPLRGVIHAAGVLDDGVLLQQNWQRFKQVLQPKVQGAWNLHKLTQKYELDRFVLFSSASSLIGAAGQANYGAANNFLDNLAHARKSQGLPAIAINWGGWKNMGLAANTQVKQGWQKQGISTILPEQGLEILEQLLSNSIAQIGVIPINWSQWNKHNQLIPFYVDLVSPTANSTVNSAQSEKFTIWQQQLSNSDAYNRQSLLIQLIKQELAQILGIKDLTAIDNTQGFSELGLDSLSSVELRNKLQTSLDIKLSLTALFDYPNVQAIANHISDIFFVSTTAISLISNKETELTQLEQLSEVQAEALLIEELGQLNRDY